MKCHDMTRTAPRAILLEKSYEKKVSSEGSTRQVLARQNE